VCPVQPGAHQVTEAGPASAWVLHGLTPGAVGALPWLTWVPAWCHPARGHLCSLLLLPVPGWEQASPPCPAASAVPAGSLWWSAAHGRAPISAAAPGSCSEPWVLPGLCPAMYSGPCGLAQWWRSHPSRLWSYLHLLPGAEQPQGSVPTFPSAVLGDCIFGIKSELCLPP